MSEHDEQVALIQWADLFAHRHPELALLFAVPNGGYRSRRTAGRLKAEGVRAGVPDLCLPVARDGYHGLYVELKAAKGRLQPNQRDWIERLQAQGYRVEVCYGAEAAIATIEEYLSIATPKD